MDEEMVHVDAGDGHGHHPATQGYNEYSQGQMEAQQRRQQRRRASQQRAASMGHANLDYTQPSQNGDGPRSAGNPERARSGSPPPIERRGSMSETEQQRRRQQIKAILADRSIPEVERRKSIQALMDGRRSSIGSQASYGSSYGGAMSHASSHHSSHAGGGGGASFAIYSAGSATSASGGGAPTALQAHIAAGGTHPQHHQGGGPASVHSGQHSVASGHQYPHHHHHSGMSPAGQQSPHGSHPDDRTVHSASAVLVGYKPKSHPYNSSTTPVPAVAAQDQAFYHQQTATEHSKRAELSRPACEHYNRNCTIVSPCCGAAFGCRICHDDCPVLPPVIQQEADEPMGMSSGLGIMDHEGPGSGGGASGAGGGRYPRSTSMPVSLASFGEPQHHTIDRHAIREVICRRCYTRQSSKT